MSKKECFQTSIREYETIRPYLRSMYLYGCCTKKYMTDKGLTTSARKFEEDTRRTRAIIQDRIDEVLTARRRSLRVNVSGLDTDENYLAASYFIRAFGRNDFAIHFAVLLALAESSGIGSTALVDRVNEMASQSEIISNSTIRRFLSGMEAEGLIVHEKGYSLPPDPFAKLSDEEIGSLITAVDFYKNVLMVGIMGEYAHSTLKHYACFSRGIMPPPDSMFMFRYRHLERIVDDATLLPLIQCIQAQKKAEYTYNRKKYEGFPRKIRYDTFYGRQYVVMHNGERHYLLPLTNICNVSVLSDIADKCAKPDSFLRYSWFAAYPKKETEPAVTVRVWFYIGKEEQYILERLRREKRHGTITTDHEGKYLFKIKLVDPHEILPWLRSFLGYAVIEKSGKHDLFERYAACVSEMRKIYGV